jgi:hypothetical protein
VPITHKVYSSRSLSIDTNTFVGEAGRLFYEQTTGTGHAPVLKYSDGSTPGGLPLSGSSLTFSGSTPPVNPHDGLLWWSTEDGRLYIYYQNTWVDGNPQSSTASYTPAVPANWQSTVTTISQALDEIAARLTTAGF